MLLDVVAVITFIIGLAITGIGLVVFFANKNSELNRCFMAFIVSLSLWLITNYLGGNPNEPYSVIFWSNRAVLIFGGLSVMTMLDFIINLAGMANRFRRSIFALYALNLVSWLLCLTPFVVRDVTVENGTVVNIFGNLALVYFLPLFVIALALCVALIVLRFKTIGVTKRQIVSLSNVTIFAVVVIIVGNAIMPILGNYALVNYTPLSVSMIAMMTIYSMVNHQLFDIRQATMRTVGYALSIVTMALIYVAIAYGLAAFFFRGRLVDGISFSPINIILALTMAVVFQPIKHFFDRLTNSIFYHGEYDRDVFLRELGRILSYDTDLKLLMRQAGTYISQNLKADKFAFFLINHGYYDGGRNKLTFQQKDMTTLIDYYRGLTSAELLDAERLDQASVETFFKQNAWQLALPLTIKQRTLGFLFLGEHKSRGYSQRDINTLESIANELSIAIQNSLSVEEIREINANLQQNINQATEELRSKNRRLKQIDEAKDDFISIASHQLRTPLTSIKGYVDMLLEGDFGKLTTKQQSVLNDVFASSEHMVQLINDFLNVSRIQTGKFALERRPVNITQMVEKEINLMTASLKQRDLKINWRYDNESILVDIDADKIRQVIVNILDNAIYYSKPGTSIKVELTSTAENLTFKVVDTGIGVPLKEQSDLFNKFFRASNARKRRPDGTGVGLYLAKKIIDAHGGEVIFESTEGKGSVFGFKLPIQ